MVVLIVSSETEGVRLSYAIVRCKKWRRVRDSNPHALSDAGFQDRCNTILPTLRTSLPTHPTGRIKLNMARMLARRVVDFKAIINRLPVSFSRGALSAVLIERAVG